MKKIKYSIGLLMLLLSASVFAVDDFNSNTTQTQQSQSGAAASNDGNAQIINNNSAPGVTYSGKFAQSSVPPVVAPGLTTTLTETCMGSSTAGASWLGMGIAGGTTWKDEECVRRLNARELAQTLGEKDAAKELMCGNQEINAVYQSLGRPCLMKASGTGLIPGGALINYRTPVEPKPQPVSQVERQVAPVVVQQVPVVHEEVTDEQDLQGQQAQQTLKNADIARAAMKTKYGW